MGEGAGYGELLGMAQPLETGRAGVQASLVHPTACLNTKAATADNNKSSKSGFLLRSEKTGTGCRQEQAF